MITVHKVRVYAFCAYGKCNHVLALFDPLSQKRHLAIKLLRRIKILLSFVVVARCTCHRFGARLRNQYCKSTVEKCYQEIMLAVVMICVCTISLTRFFISPLAPGNAKTQQIAMGWLRLWCKHAGVRAKNSNASPTPFLPSI